MKVIEIFDSIDGEGIRTGQCATFIRLAGCTYAVRTAIRFIHCSVKKRLVNILK